MMSYIMSRNSIPERLIKQFLLLVPLNWPEWF